MPVRCRVFDGWCVSRRVNLRRRVLYPGVVYVDERLPQRHLVLAGVKPVRALMQQQQRVRIWICVR